MSYKKINQRGIALPLVIIVVIVVLAGAAGAFWFITSKDKNADKVTQLNPNVSASEAQASLDACLKAGGDNDLCTFAASYNGLDGAYSAEAQHESGNMKISYDGKGNSMVESPTGSIINLNGASYVKSGKIWIKYPAAPNNESLPVDIDSVNDTLDIDENTPEGSLKDTFKKLGNEACGNLDCFKYQLTTTADTGSTDSFIWFDTKEYKLRKMEYTDAEGKVFSMTFNYGDVTITEPSPVQEFNTSGFGQ